MVCNRCIATVLHEFNVHGFNVKSVELGQVVLKGDKPHELAEVELALKNHGFELINDGSKALIEAIKTAFIKKMETNNEENINTYLTKNFDRSYSALSKAFSKSEGITLEKYEINLRIEKAKEFIQLQQLNFSEIAYELGYKNSSHLARQFKSITGMSMTTYNNLQQWNRKKLDQIV